jgi:lipopolysaccharide transport system permease protein
MPCPAAILKRRDDTNRAESRGGAARGPNRGAGPRRPGDHDRGGPEGLRQTAEYRELLYFLAWRDFKARYKQTAFGIAWAVLQPVVTVAIFAVVFGGFVDIPSEGFPYPVFAFAGLLPWTYFSQSIIRGGSSLVASSSLVSKVYFPRLLIPIASMLTPLVDFMIAFLVLLVLMAWYGIVPTVGIVALPLLIVLTFATALAVSFWLSSLNVRYRDVGFMLHFLAQIWLYASPVIYPVSSVPEQWRLLYGLNPMVGVIEGFRWALLGKEAPDLGVMAVGMAAVVVLLVFGVRYFTRTERTFADVI